MAAAAASDPRGQLASLSVLAAFLLGALWLASALHISRSMERCLAVEGSVWRDEECLIMIKWTTIAAVLALAYAAVLSRWEAVRREQDAAGGAKQKEDGPPDRELECSQDRISAQAIRALAFVHVYMMPAVLIFWGKAFRYAGARRLEKDPADGAAANLFKIDPFCYNAGYLSLSVVHCCSVIPYMFFLGVS